jgi:putative transposase
MFDVTDLLPREHNMTKGQNKAEIIDEKALLERDKDFLRSGGSRREITQAIWAEKGERSPAWLAYRSGYYGRSLITRVGTLELMVPQDRQGRFSTHVFERYQRCEKALVGALAEMYARRFDPQGQGDHPGSVRSCVLGLSHHQQNLGHASLKACAERRLSEDFPRGGRDRLPGGPGRGGMTLQRHFGPVTGGPALIMHSVRVLKIPPRI